LRPVLLNSTWTTGDREAQAALFEVFDVHTQVVHHDLPGPMPRAAPEKCKQPNFVLGPGKIHGHQDRQQLARQGIQAAWLRDTPLGSQGYPVAVGHRLRR